ncbi:hypothetical protein ACTHOQ_00810 [Solibacillus silvestris]|uniref:hypothetical protein n=1 Tax=Solibacillus silvestris TaxID=76853 RepID=UPI003F7F0E10
MQLSLFELEHEHCKPKFQLMDRVKVQLIDEQIDSELHHYRKYYEPHILNKAGEITNIQISGSGTITYEVDIYGVKHHLLEQELIDLL